MNGELIVSDDREAHGMHDGSWGTGDGRTCKRVTSRARRLCAMTATHQLPTRFDRLDSAEPLY